MNNQPVLYDSLRTILHHMDANARINMSTRIPSIRATEKAVPLKINNLSFSDTTADINDVRYQLGVCRDYPKRHIPESFKRENVRGGVSHDFDRFGFEIPIGSSPILPGDVSVRNKNQRVRRTDTDELEQQYRTDLTIYEHRLRSIVENESGERALLSEYWENSREYKEYLQCMATYAREKLKPFHCRRHNLPRPFNCYIQLSVMKDGEAKPLQRLPYTRKLYEAVKQFNHILFANRSAIRVNRPVFFDNHVYRIPVGFKISANELTLRKPQIASLATMIEDVNMLRVSEGGNAENWWQHRFVKNSKELITEGPPSVEESCMMLRTFGCRIIRFHNLRTFTSEQYCQLIENWMSVKREVGSELWVGLDKKRRKNVPKKMQTRMEVIRRDDKNGTQIETSSVNRLKERWQNRLEVFEKDQKDERSVRLRGENGTQIEICGVVCENETMRHRLKVKIVEN
ncbi:hypothetical protein B9Z55_007766 [Caenorhabditis nigoni]|uniref:Uncharacterized protein n=1 Tax=Caenorhabditis nigoni TaxID=1611254 RepID=A0A2G5VB84_9PELO|nr:hypothetical protein B9Z55_007766 [Caenorhabditis nigoni]